MHCPRCGQQQASDNVKFCSRCGFLLELVPELLANGGILPQLAELNKNKKWLTRKNGIKFGVVWLIVMWFVVAPLGLIVDADVLFAMGGVFGFAGFVLSMIISFLFLDNKPQFANPQVSFRSDAMPHNLSGNAPPHSALPPQQSVPASSYIPPQQQTGRWHTTNDLTTPGSVTEQTTKLLEKDE